MNPTRCAWSFLVVASICHLQAQTPEETTYIGTTGLVKVHSPAHAPTRVTVSKVPPREIGRAHV